MSTIILILVVFITSLLTLLFIYFLISVIINKNNGSSDSDLNARLNPQNGYSLSYVNILNVPDQGKLKSCGAVQISTLMSYYYYIQLNNTTILSALALYYYGRTINGDGSYIDNGSTIDNYLNAINTYGLLSENDWPYIQSDFYKKPYSSNSSNSSTVFQPKLRWNTVDTNITTIKDFIKSGMPVLLDIMIYKSFTNPNLPGLIVVPNINDSDSYVARHTVSLWGWDDDYATFIMLNTWGTSAGYKGWFFLPYDYILKPSLSTQFFYNMSFIKNFTYG